MDDPGRDVKFEDFQKKLVPTSKSVEFSNRLRALEDELIQQAGKLEFMESAAVIQLSEIRRQQSELGALAADVKKTRLDLEIHHRKLLIEALKGDDDEKVNGIQSIINNIEDYTSNQSKI